MPRVILSAARRTRTPYSVKTLSGNRTVGPEPANADDVYRSLREGRIAEDDAPQTIADGLKVSMRPRTWHFVSNYAADVLLVTEEQIARAMYLAWQRMKIVIEVDLVKLPWMQGLGLSEAEGE